MEKDEDPALFPELLNEIVKASASPLDLVRFMKVNKIFRASALAQFKNTDFWLAAIKRKFGKLYRRIFHYYIDDIQALVTVFRDSQYKSVLAQQNLLMRQYIYNVPVHDYLAVIYMLLNAACFSDALIEVFHAFQKTVDKYGWLKLTLPDGSVVKNINYFTDWDDETNAPDRPLDYIKTCMRGRWGCHPEPDSIPTTEPMQFDYRMEYPIPNQEPLPSPFVVKFDVVGASTVQLPCDGSSVRIPFEFAYTHSVRGTVQLRGEVTEKSVWIYVSYFVEYVYIARLMHSTTESFKSPFKGIDTATLLEIPVDSQSIATDLLHLAYLSDIYRYWQEHDETEMTSWYHVTYDQWYRLLTLLNTMRDAYQGDTEWGNIPRAALETCALCQSQSPTHVDPVALKAYCRFCAQTF